MENYPNAKNFKSGGVRLTSRESRVKLPDVSVPDGMTLFVKNNTGNPAGTIIYVGQDNSIDELSWSLLPGEMVGLDIKNANLITVGFLVGAPVNPLIVNYIVEVNNG
jgi:hypothetical protein